MANRIYVGITPTERKVFLSPTTPTEASHGHLYMAVIGPFRTVPGAQFMAQFGANNPHCQTVEDAERLAVSAPPVPQDEDEEEETRERITCDQCELLAINGICCHEIGCPNMGARWDAENREWIKQRKCFECGCTVDRDDPCCSAPFEDDEPEPEDDDDEAEDDKI